MGKIPVDTNLHQSTLLQRLNGMRGTKDHCDFTIRVGSTEIFAHRNILSAGSDYFAAMLSHDTKEKQTGIVDIKEADPTCIKKCIDFIYTGISPDLDDDIEQLMYSAHLLQLTTLCDGIFKLLDEELSLKFFFLTWKLANMYDNKELINNCDSFVHKNLEAISKMVEFGHFDKRLVEKMLTSKDIDISEACRLDALLRWVKFQAGERKKFFVKMLKFFTLSNISTGYLRHLIENETLIKDDSKVLLQFSVAVMDNASIKARTSDASQTEDALAFFDMSSGYLQSFILSENFCIQMHEMNDDMKQTEFSAVSIGHYIYVFMGSRSIYKYDHLDEAVTWELVGNTNNDHGRCPPIVALHNCICVIGGYTVQTKSVEKFDLLSNKCIELTDKQHSLTEAALVALNNKIYCCGGALGRNTTAIVDCFDIEGSTWTTTSPMNEAKCGMSAIACNDKFYVLGGWNGTARSNSVECYDASTSRWSSLKNMAAERYLFRSFEINGDIYAVGGARSSKTIEKYDVSKDVWTDVEIPVDINGYFIAESVKIKLIP